MELRFRAFWSVTLDLSSFPQAELCRVSSQVFTVTVTVTAGLNFSRIWSQVLRPSVQSMRWRRRYGRCQMSSLIDTKTSPPLVGLLNVSSQNVAISGKVWSPGFNHLWFLGCKCCNPQPSTTRQLMNAPVNWDVLENPAVSTLPLADTGVKLSSLTDGNSAGLQQSRAHLVCRNR